MPSWFIDIVKQTVSILLAVSPLLVPQVRDFVAKSVQLSFDKALENKKTLNERKNYISKVKFDKEFQIYTQLSEYIFDLIFESSKVSSFLGDVIQIYDFRDMIERIQDKYNIANQFTQRHAAFINQEIYNEYYKLFKLYRELLTYITCLDREAYNFNAYDDYKIIIEPLYEDNDLSHNFIGKEYTYVQLKEEAINTQKKISKQSDEISNKLRSYLDTLEVIK
ncbi:hypothetical protein [Negativibacillus massiliensis]|uniref:hypothetical protein n=1 Tax=Negativibacillus massiliensis TaxID=1871035 RepID=UPI0003394AED|nr:hypothetical protein [Negativibacillus massiliensis]CDA79208.1 unknown [Clostridium sp. CAG:242]